MELFKPLPDQWNISFGSPVDPTIFEEQLYFSQVVQPSNDIPTILKGLSLLPPFTQIQRGTLKLLCKDFQCADECVAFRFRMSSTGDSHLPFFDNCDEFLMGLVLLLMNDGFSDLQRGSSRVIGLVLCIRAQVVDIKVLVSNPKLIHSLKSKMQLLLQSVSASSSASSVALESSVRIETNSQ